MAHADRQEVRMPLDVRGVTVAAAVLVFSAPTRYRPAKGAAIPGLQVFRIDAQGIAANAPDYMALRGNAELQMIGNAMSRRTGPDSRHWERPVALAMDRSPPRPARFRAITLVDLLPEVLDECGRICTGFNHIFCPILFFHVYADIRHRSLAFL
jgi:hypothetical protein